LEVEHGEHGLQERGVHPLALAGALALDEGDQDALGEEDARAQIRNGDAHAHWSLARDARDGHEATHALRDLIDARPVAIRSALPEPGDADVDQARVVSPQAFVVDAEPPLDVGTIVLDHDVGGARELLEDGDALRLAEIEGHALLAAMQVLEVETVAIASHAVTGAPTGHLDLDGPGAPVHELPHARGSGASAGEVEDGVAGQREGGVGGHGRLLPAENLARPAAARRVRGQVMASFERSSLDAPTPHEMDDHGDGRDDE